MSAGMGTSKVRIPAHPSRPGAAHPSPSAPNPAKQTSKFGVVAAAAAKWHVPMAIMWGVYGIETGFGTNVHNSSAGAEGQFQFLPSTWAAFGHGDPSNLADAADAAGHYLSYLHSHFGSWDSAIRHYSGGGYGYSDVIKKSSQGGDQALATAQGTKLTTGLPTSALGAAALGPLGIAAGAISGVSNPLDKLFSKQVWTTIGKLVLGSVLLLMALHMAASRMGVYSAVKKTTAKAGKIGKVASVVK